MLFFISLIFALILFIPVSYLMDLYRFKFDLKKYNIENPEYEIPIPGGIRDLNKLFRRFLKVRWGGDFFALYYADYGEEYVDD